MDLLYPIWIESVSYTHLDVYKRQVQASGKQSMRSMWAIKEIEVALLINYVFTFLPVSNHVEMRKTNTELGNAEVVV